MLRHLFRYAFKLALVAGVGAAVSKALARRRSEPFAPVSTAPWPPIESTPPVAAPDTGVPGTEAPATGVPGVEVPAAETSSVQAPSTPVPADEPAELGDTLWVEPDDEGECPTSHPIKAKLGSGVFHLPGMANYERTKADRCYPDSETAEADDLRQAQR